MLALKRFVNLSGSTRKCFHQFIYKQQSSTSKIVPVQRGSFNSLDYRIFYQNGANPISPFHDIPLQPSPDVFSMVVEIPRWTNAKLEIAVSEPLNPIKHDEKKGKIRHVANIFPYHGYIWNYGAIPQTWENPAVTERSTGCKGDNDPLDAIDLGSRLHERGAVIHVKLLGCVGLIDEGEMDWKMLVIDVNDPKAGKMNDLSDIEKQMPGYLRATTEWFRNYKIPSGSPPNKLAFNGEAKDKEFSMTVLNETNEQWKKLSMKQIENKTGIALETTTCSDSPFNISISDAQKIIKGCPPAGQCQPEEDPFSVHKWHYIQ